MGESNIGEVEDIRNFFPATSDYFVAKCGKIESIKASDFDDVHRKRHLDSFKKSWAEWEAYDSDLARHSNSIDEDKLQEFIIRIIQSNPKTPSQFHNSSVQRRRELKVAPSKSQMLNAYEKLLQLDPQFYKSKVLESFLIKKTVRTHSGMRDNFLGFTILS